MKYYGIGCLVVLRLFIGHMRKCNIAILMYKEASEPQTSYDLILSNEKTLKAQLRPGRRQE